MRLVRAGLPSSRRPTIAPTARFLFQISFAAAAHCCKVRGMKKPMKKAAARKAEVKKPVAKKAAAKRAAPKQRTPKKSRSEEHTSELQSPCNLVCRLLLEKKKKKEAPYIAVMNSRSD